MTKAHTCGYKARRRSALKARRREADAPRCQWFALCDHAATTTRPHPVLGDVPICVHCSVKLTNLERPG